MSVLIQSWLGKFNNVGKYLLVYVLFVGTITQENQDTIIIDPEIT